MVMNQEKLQHLIETMEPQEALQAIAMVVRNLFAVLGEEAWQEFVVTLVGETATDRTAGMVHL
jgi:hypothetical protein